MTERSVKVADIDLEALRGEIKKVQPERMTYQAVLEQLRPDLEAKTAEGASVRALSEALSGKGIKVSERSLKTFLETGKLSRPRTAPNAKEPSRSSSDQPIE